MGVPIVSHTITYTNPRTGETSKFRTTNIQLQNQIDDIQKSGFIIDKIESASTLKNKPYNVNYTRSSGGGGSGGSSSSNTKKEETKIVEEIPVVEETKKVDIPKITKTISPSTAAEKLAEQIGDVSRYKPNETIKNVPAGTTATPETLVFRETGSGIEVKPSFQQQVKDYTEGTENLRTEMNRLQKYLVGYQDNNPTKPIYVTKTRANADFGYKPFDADYLQADVDIKNQIKPIEKNIETIDKNIKDVKGYSLYIEDQIKNIADVPDDTMFEVDFDADGTVDDVFNKTRFNDYLQKQLKENRETIDYLRSERETQEGYLSDARNIKNIIGGYKTLGYEMDITDSGSYSFFEPSNVDVMEWKYGKTGANILIATSTLLDSPLGVRTVGDILTGNNPRERLAGRSLDMSKTLETKGVGKDFLVGDVAGSPAFVEGVIVPSATMGLGYGVGSVVGKTGGTIAKIGSKINRGASKFFSPAGKQIFTKTLSGVKTVSKPFTTAAKVMGKSRIGKASFIAGIYGVSEAPRLYDVYKNNPKDLGGVFAESVFTFGLQMGAFKQGMKAAVKPKTVKTVMQDQLIQSKDVEIKQRLVKKPFRKPYTEFEGGMTAEITGSKKPVNVTFKGKSFSTKSGTISKGKMLVYQDVSKNLVKAQNIKVYDFVSRGDISYSLTNAEGVKLLKVSSFSINLSKDQKNLTTSLSQSIVRDAGEKEITRSFIEYGRNADGFVDYNVKIYADEPAFKSDFVSGGRFLSRSGQKGSIVFKGKILNIVSGESSLKYDVKTPRNFLKDTYAASRLGRVGNQKTISINFLQDVGVNVSDFNASLPAMNVKTSNIAAKTVALPILTSNISSNIVKQDKYNVTSTKQNIKTTNKTIQITPLKYNVANEIKQDRLISNITTNSFITETKQNRRSIIKNAFDFASIQNVKQDVGLMQDVRSKYTLKKSQASIQQYDLSLVSTGIGGFGFDFKTINPIPVVPTPFIRMGAYYTAILDKPKVKNTNLIRSKRNYDKLEKGLLPSPLNVLRSQILYGKASKPKLTKELWLRGEKSLFMDVPTKEQIKGKKRKKYVLM